MNKKLLISNINIKQEDGFNILSAYVDGDLIFFKVPDKFPLYINAEWFIGISLLEAMVSQRDIEVDAGVAVSRVFYDQLSELQTIYSKWNPKLKKIALNCELSNRDKQFTHIGSFFSAGVDSSFTLIARRDEITHLVMLRGFDMGDDDLAWNRRIEHQAAFAESSGKQLIPVDTNARDWTEKKEIGWSFAHGLLISSAGGNLGMKRLYVASSHTYDHLLPWGSHPLTDPMWSTESTQVVHHGSGTSRSQKTKTILESPSVAENLQVCWENIDKNCGECSKCIRTMAAVFLLNGDVKSLPKFQMSQLKKLQPTSDSLKTTVIDLLLLADETGNIEFYKKLKKYYLKYERSKIGSLVDKCFLNSILKKTYRRIRKPRWLTLRVIPAYKENHDL
ncbi:MAG: hypothetical protein ABJM39_02200 [Porticoccus sp.]|uniref:hypothetical protein n=1 Tax=Porticoccus sp. TaxID=2024853 RepID=UPI000C35FA2E|nr:hypothetical protein [Porticoccus sp.]MAZ69597.1 hypothetical protein [Porticoccus sp.]|tara:strand:- start:1333 stop:2505 length:1173 start_codon:yes stop_codon:yes gene_type:complete